MQILHVIGELSKSRGGPVTALKGIVSVCNELGHASDIVTALPDGDEIAFGSARNIYHFKRFGPKRRMYCPGFNQWLKTHATHYDLIWVHEIWNLNVLQALTVLPGLRVPFVVMPHASLDYDIFHGSNTFLKSILSKTVLKRALCASQAILAASEMELERIQRFGCETPLKLLPLPVNEPLDVQPGAVTYRSALSIPKGAFVVLSLSRIHPVKGISLLVAAMEKLADVTPEVHLVIAGSGHIHYETAVRDNVLKSPMRKRIHITGFVDSRERPRLMREVDLYALPSERESFGMGVIEAVQAGTPALLSKTVGIAPSLVKRGCGWLAERDPQAIADAIRRIAADREGLAAARIAAKQYGDSFRTSSLCAVYNEVLFGRSDAAGLQQSLNPSKGIPAPQHK